MDKYTSLEFSKWLAENGFEGEGKYDCFHIMRYDILNDLCVRYAKEIFFEGKTESKEKIGYEVATTYILMLIQQNKKDEAEKYIMEHSILNPKKKLS